MKHLLFPLIIIATVPCLAARYALLAGNSMGGGKTERLQYVENDIVKLQKTLFELCGFDKQNILTVLNGTPGDLKSGFTLMSEKLEKEGGEGLFLFYYSGHADRENLKMGERVYSLADLKRDFSVFPANLRIAIFDACQSGMFTRLKGGKLAEPFLFKNDKRIQGQVILSSSSDTENSQESDLYGNSIFTFHFLNALRGSGDFSGDSRVTLNEAYQYSYNKTVSTTVRTSGGIQHPAYQFKIQGEGDIVLADLTVRTTGMILGQDVPGIFTVSDEKGNVVADLEKESGSSVMIALNPGRYQVVRSSGGSKYQAAVDVRGTVKEVTRDDFARIGQHQSKPKGLLVLKKGFSIRIVSGFDQFYLSSLSRQIDRRFSDHNYFNLYPAFDYPLGRFNIGIEGELLLMERFAFSMAFKSLTFDGAHEYHSSRLNVLDSLNYGCYLSTRDSLKLNIVSLGIGYRIHKGPLTNLCLGTGLNIFSMDFYLNSLFRDSLYDIEASSSYSENGSIVTPYVSASYTYPLTRYIEVGAKLRYRYQKQGVEVDNSSGGGSSAPFGGSPEPFKYNLKGWDGALYFSFRVMELFR
jgi:hypothetical protein